MRWKKATTNVWQSAGEYDANNPEQGPVPVTNQSATGGTAEVQGDLAEGAAVTGSNPFLGASRYDSTQPTAVADGQVAVDFSDAYGRKRVINDGALNATDDMVTAVGAGDLIDVTLVCDTSILADGDLISDRVVVTNALRAINANGILESVVVFDEDDQGTAIDLIFLNADVTLGSLNAAPSISDANARNILGIVSVQAADFKDLGGVRVATLPSVGLLLKSVSGARTVYVAAQCRSGTPTYTASGLKLRLGVLWN